MDTRLSTRPTFALESVMPILETGTDSGDILPRKIKNNLKICLFPVSKQDKYAIIISEIKVFIWK